MCGKKKQYQTDKEDTNDGRNKSLKPFSFIPRKYHLQKRREKSQYFK